ncbi:MAG TPA: co-chaperone GroES [Candidatus Paceibacterota bacterium]|nr:co-chaperone GroES [Candidatus Paceibacterota bacterium]
MKDNKQKGSKIGIQPLQDRVLIRELAPGENRKTASGIIIPDGASEDRGAKQGTVVAVGKGKYDDGKLVPPEVQAGDSVLFEWGTKIKHEGDEYYLVTESAILAVIK